MFLSKLFKKEIKKETENKSKKSLSKGTEKIAARKGELGEYKIDIQLSQLPKEFKVLNDLMIVNSKAKSGYSQIDHIVISPYGFFVIETKNYQGTIYGASDRKEWLVNGKFKFMNPFVQNYGHIQAVKNLIAPKYHEFFISVVSFTKRCTFKTDLAYRKIQSGELIVYDVELTEFINRKVAVLRLQYSEPIMSLLEIETIYKAISESNIVDKEKRKNHIDLLKITSPPEKCTICGVKVTTKVAQYCQSNKKFQGKIYCYDHQKEVNL
jgi:hypothetical protein